ncbi:MAG: hypothetical protein Q9161_008660 [Pseudevernia consocians]
MGAPSQVFASIAAAPRQNDPRGYANARAHDAAAMSPPPLPFKPQNGHPQVLDSYQSPYSKIEPPVFDDTQADSTEAEDIGGSDSHVPEPKYPYTSDDEIAAMTARSEEAMAEIHRMCEPFFGHGSNFPEPPPMELRAGLIEELGINFMFPNHEGDKVCGKSNEDAMPNPAHTMPAWNVAQRTMPMPPKNQDIKRKEYDGDHEHSRQVQFDVERQAHPPIKRVKSVHTANLQKNNTTFYHDTAYNARQQHFAPSTGDHQWGLEYGSGLDRPALQGGRHFSVGGTEAHIEDGLPEQN